MICISSLRIYFFVLFWLTVFSNDNFLTAYCTIYIKFRQNHLYLLWLMHRYWITCDSYRRPKLSNKRYLMILTHCEIYLLIQKQQIETWIVAFVQWLSLLRVWFHLCAVGTGVWLVSTKTRLNLVSIIAVFRNHRVLFYHKSMSLTLHTLSYK